MKTAAKRKSGRLVKKTIELDESAIEICRCYFNAETDKAAVNSAIRLIVEESEIIATHKKLGGQVRLTPRFS